MGETMGAIRKPTTFLLGTALAAAVLLSGCSPGDDASDKQAGTTGYAADQGSAGQGSAGQDSTGKDSADRAAAPAAAAPEAAAGTAQDKPAQSPDLSVDQRSIIYRGSLSVRLKDDNVDAVAAQVSGIATTAGGFIGSDERHSGSGTGTATMQLRIPADRFTGVVDQLARLGTEEQRQISTEDVTEQTVDLDARISVQQARVDSGRRLLAQAKSLNDLVMLEKEVATRESDLASLQAKKRRLADLTALSTITVTLLTPDATVVPPKDAADPGFLAGLRAGWDALLASLRVLLTVLGALLPWLVAFGLPLWGLFHLYRRFVRSPRSHRWQPAFAGGRPLPGWKPPPAEATTPPAEATRPPAEEPPAS
jgi:uncharacterized protein DUF4349